MASQFTLYTLLLYVVNMSMIITLSSLSTMITDIAKESALTKIYTPNVRGLLYCLIIIIIGINIFSFFIVNNLNDYILHRILTPYGFRTKLRVVSQIII